MEDEIVDIDNVDNAFITGAESISQSHEVKPTFTGARRSARVRPPIGTYATLRRRSLSPETTSKRAIRNTHKSSKKKGSTKGEATPKLKLKLGDRSSALNNSFLGPWDRELDSDDDELAFEEQFILRMPDGEDCERLRKMVAARDLQDDVWFKFKDSRRAMFHIGNTTYNAKLVDLPAIIESQKTLDNRQMFKVSDICQMLVVEDPIHPESMDTSGAPHDNQSKTFDVRDFIWPHGLTPPLKWVRKRRFRKRVNRTTIETVEQEVERLLAEDDKAEETVCDVLENVNPDLSDSEYDNENVFDRATPGLENEGDGGSVGTLRLGEEEEESSEEEDDDDDDGFDAAFAAEIDQVDLDGAKEGTEVHSSDEDAEDGDLFGDGLDVSVDEDDDDDEDEDDEVIQARKLLNEEIRDLEAAVEKKVAEIATVQNPLIKRRFEDALKKLRVDLDSRQAQREELTERKRAKEEARAQIEANSINVGLAGGEPGIEDDDGDEESDDDAETGEALRGGIVAAERATSSQNDT